RGDSSMMVLVVAQRWTLCVDAADAAVVTLLTETIAAMATKVANTRARRRGGGGRGGGWWGGCLGGAWWWGWGGGGGGRVGGGGWLSAGRCAWTRPTRRWRRCSPRRSRRWRRRWRTRGRGGESSAGGWRCCRGGSWEVLCRVRG